MAKELRIRRGTTAQHSTFTGAEGEATVDTTKDTLVVHDGTTVGGHPLAKENLANVPAGSVTTAMLANSSVTTDKIAAGAVVTADLADAAVTAAKLASGAAVSNIGFTPANSTATVNLTGDQTVGGTKTFTNGVRFNDGTTQTTAAGALTTTAVLNATAGATVGVVGTYAFLAFPNATASIGTGATYAGSSLRYASAEQNTGTPAGTWRLMGLVTSVAGYTTTSAARSSVWLRIS